MLAPDDRDLVLGLAEASINAGLAGDGPAIPPLDDITPALREPRGAFVTVKIADELNGCIGTIEASEALGLAVPRLAWESAFDDPRLPPLRRLDVAAGLTHVEISVLSPMREIAATSEQLVVETLQPGRDGLLLIAGYRRATFLPSVWEQLPAPHDFVRHLEFKAGIPPGEWPAGIAAFVYTTEGFGRTISLRDGAASSRPRRAAM